MKKKVIVLSLGGSLIVPDEVDIKFLEKFKKVLLKNLNKYKFIIVCGGGSIARKYISALNSSKMSLKFQGLSGISATRMNARFMSYYFGFDQKFGIAHTLATIDKYIKTQNVVFCGALEYKINQTSDSNAAEIANHFKTIFINLTNVPGLYDKNPKKYKSAKFIPEISWKDFFIMANAMTFKPGQHFVLDQISSKIILKHKVPTYILGEDMKQLDNFLNKRKFVGTVIRD